MNKDSGIKLKELQVSGGMTKNKLLMQLQADVLGIPVIRQSMHETTAFGAALAAGITIGVWDLKSPNEIPINVETYNSMISDTERNERFRKWKKAVKRSMDWDDNRSIRKKL